MRYSFKAPESWSDRFWSKVFDVLTSNVVIGVLTLFFAATLTLVILKAL